MEQKPHVLNLDQSHAPDLTFRHLDHTSFRACNVFVEMTDREVGVGGWIGEKITELVS